MKLLILGINYAPEKIGIAVYTSGMAEALAADGHEVNVITAQPYYPDWRVQTGWPRWLYKRIDEAERLKVLHCPLYVPNVPTGVKRILHHASFAASAFFPALWRARALQPNVVLVVAPSMISALPGLAAARLGGASTWLHIQDFEVEAAFATGLLSSNGRIGRAARAFEAWVLRRFDRISTISDAMLAKLTEKGVPVEKIVAFRNWADLSNVPGGETDTAFKAELGITTPHVALYSGNLANKQGLEILPALARALEHRDDLTVLVCGDGPNRASLEEASRGLSNIVFCPLQPKAKLGALLSVADVHLLPQIAGAADLVLPSKLTNMLASGRPIIATALPNSALASELVNCGRITSPGDGMAMAAAVIDLIDAPELRVSLGQAARARAESHWAEKAVLGRFKADLRALTDGQAKTAKQRAISRSGAI